MNETWRLLSLDQTLFVVESKTALPIYDFSFHSYLPCKSIRQAEQPIEAIGRIGAFQDYAAKYQSFLSQGIKLIHTPEEHERSSRLPAWYPMISELTPASRWFTTELPSAAAIEGEFGWPVFVKGERQTSRHQRALSIVENRAQFEQAMQAYRDDPILRWQSLVVRKLLPLRLVEDADPNRIPASFEFRTFWWRGELVGAGRYWWQSRPYPWNDRERDEGLAVARLAARRVGVPFLVVDIAMTQEGRWVVIECNDAQESGYAGVSPLGLWQNILRLADSSKEDCEFQPNFFNK